MTKYKDYLVPFLFQVDHTITRPSVFGAHLQKALGASMVTAEPNISRALLGKPRMVDKQKSTAGSIEKLEVQIY
jgi:hypothetical protein